MALSVTLFERHDQAGGRARSFEAEGFTFDMGPSWYWMPDVFERFFYDFDTSVEEQYELKRLDPSYRVVFGDGNQVDVPAQLDQLYAMCDRMEPGSAKRLRKFLAEAEYKYEVGMSEFVEKPSHNLLEFADARVLAAALKLHMLTDMERYVERQFKDRRLRQILKISGALPRRDAGEYAGALLPNELRRPRARHLVPDGRDAEPRAGDGARGERSGREDFVQPDGEPDRDRGRAR